MEYTALEIVKAALPAAEDIYEEGGFVCAQFATEGDAQRAIDESGLDCDYMINAEDGYATLCVSKDGLGEKTEFEAEPDDDTYVAHYRRVLAIDTERSRGSKNLYMCADGKAEWRYQKDADVFGLGDIEEVLDYARKAYPGHDWRAVGEITRLVSVSDSKRGLCSFCGERAEIAAIEKDLGGLCRQCCESILGKGKRLHLKKSESDKEYTLCSSREDFEAMTSENKEDGE